MNKLSVSFPWLLLSAAVLLVVAGCGRNEQKPEAMSPAATAPAVLAPPPCTPEKPVNIDHIAASASSASITVDHEPVTISESRGGAVRWVLKDRGYSFTNDGVVFKTPPADPAPSTTATGTPREFVWCFPPTTQPITWSYTIKFSADASPSVIWKCDPTITNSDALLSGPQTITCSSQ